MRSLKKQLLAFSFRISDHRLKTEGEQVLKKSFRHIDFGSTFRTGAVLISINLIALIGPVRTEGQTPSRDVAYGHEAVQQQECLKAARHVLGPGAKVVKCGELNQTGVLESIAAIPVAPKSHSVGGIFAKDLVILRRSRGEWRTALRAARLIQNDAGYIGVEYVDDCSPFWADHIEFSGKRPDGQNGLVVRVC